MPIQAGITPVHILRLGPEVVAAHKFHFVRCLPVCVSVCPVVLVVTGRYFWQGTYAFLGMLPCRLVVLRIYLASSVFQPYRDLEAGDNKSLKILVARPGIEPRSCCSASQELNHSATAAPTMQVSSLLMFKWD